MYAESGASMTSADSSLLVTRSAIRRFVLARMSALTTPAGRCVARIRCTPSERPRREVQLGPEPFGVPVVFDVLGARVQQHFLAPLELGAERVERADGQVTVEVADHADSVRQPRAVLERASALVVDEHERHRVR